MTTFDIVGCCICRDIFRLNPDENYKVNKFIQYVSPITFIASKPSRMLISEEEMTFAYSSNFSRRCSAQDINKTAIDFLCNIEKSDYVIIDLCELRYKVVQLTFKNQSGKEEQTFITYTKLNRTLLENVDKLDFLKDVSYEFVELSEEQVCECLEKFMCFLKDRYGEKNIILIENYLGYYHLDDQNNNVYEYNSNGVNIYNRKLRSYYEYIERLAPKMHVITPPSNSLGWTGHTWGKDQLHFVDGYYRYLYRAIQSIVSNKVDEPSRLDRIKEDYIEYFTLLERQKRMEYFLSDKLPSSLLTNSEISGEDNRAKGWKISLSKGSAYNFETHELICAGGGTLLVGQYFRRRLINQAQLVKNLFYRSNIRRVMTTT